MQRTVIDEPYTFIPPYRGRFWAGAFRLVLRRYLRTTHGLTDIDVRGLDRLKASLAAGHGVVLAPNHCRVSDPMLMGMVTAAGGIYTYTMASWHIFKQDRLSAFMVRRLGGFSLYREGTDRAALHCAIDILEKAERPLVIFPEGTVSGTNDRLLPLLEGVAFLARTAARRRAKQTPPGHVVVHPVALRYQPLFDVPAAVAPVLAEIEQRLSWPPQTQLGLYERIGRIGHALLALKEVEHLGSVQCGPLYDRKERLTEHLLAGVEREWLKGEPAGSVPARVKTLRAALLPDMAAGRVDAAERRRRWRQLADLYLAQQLDCYPRGYLRPDSPPDRFLETVERFEEDLTDRTRIYGPTRVVIDIGDPLEVPTDRDRTTGDPLMHDLETCLRSMLDQLAHEMTG